MFHYFLVITLSLFISLIIRKFINQKFVTKLKKCNKSRRRYRALGHPLPWAGGLPKAGENKYFSPYAYCFIFKNDALNPNFFEKKIIFYIVSLEKLLFR